MSVQADLATLARLGVATIHEAMGRTGLIDIELRQLIRGSRVAGPARIAACAQDDNLMVHAVMAEAQAGEVLVLTMPEPSPVALLGELLATQAAVRGVAGVLVDGAVRDVDELEGLGLPVWTRYIRARGARKDVPGRLDVPVVVGGAEIRPGDIVVLDCDGGVVVPAERAHEVEQLARAREERERKLRARLAAGELSYDVHGLRALVERSG